MPNEMKQNHAWVFQSETETVYSGTLMRKSASRAVSESLPEPDPPTTSR